MRFLAILLFSTFLCSFDVNAEVSNGGHQISIQLTNYDEPQLFLGYHYGDKQYLQDTVEKNNAGFKIERKFSGSENWTETGSVTGKGNSSEITEYSFKNKDLQPGLYNFRLKQTDFNGNYEYFELSENVNVEIPLSNILSQNYPNPFNPNSQISYEVGSGTNSKVSIRLTVYNSLGKEVATLYKGEQDPGYYKVNFNGSGYPSGVYIYVLEANGAIVGSKRMILIK